tara:strand:- start:435 stop:884 length:450 start_codon:yes stop_codon:yes gene_type:complete
MAPQLAAILAIGTGLQVASTLYSANESAKAARREQQQRLFQSKLTRIEASARANLRLKEFDSAQSSNIAFAAFMNRDVNDRSMKRFFQRQREVAYSDARMIESQGLIESTQQRMLADAAGQRARAAMIGGFLNAGSAVTTGMWRYEVAK